MGKTRSNYTLDEKVGYWKGRMASELKTAYNWCKEELHTIDANTRHLNLEEKDITNALQKIDQGFMELRAAIATAKVKKANVNERG